MEKAFKYRMYPNREQRILLAKTFGCTRFVYNHYLAKRKDAYEKEGITKEEVQQEIGRAVSIALKSPDPQMQRFWTDFPCENETPTIEEIIYHLAEKFAKES